MPPAAKLALLTALAVEYQAVSAAGVTESSNTLLLQTGLGVAHAREGVNRALQEGADAVLLLGFAGGLNPAAVPGTLLLPRQIQYQDRSIPVNAVYHRRIRERVASFAPIVDPLVCVDEPIREVVLKAQRASRGFGCDMESAGIAVANDAGVPAVVVKVVLDGPGDSIPKLALEFTGADGNRRVPSLSRRLLDVKQWSQTLALLSQYRLARRQLERVARLLLAEAGQFG